MPSPLTRLRRHVGRLLAVSEAGSPRGGGGGTQAPTVVVPLTVRTPTADGADIRLLAEARVASPRLPADELERITLALVVPAAAQWVRRRELTALNASVDPCLIEVEDAVREQLTALGAELITIQLVAVEHLIASPSADPDRSWDTA